MLRPRRPVLPVALAVSAAVLLSGCSGSSYEEVDLDGLAAACEDLRAPLQDVDAGLRELADDEAAHEQTAERFSAVQDDLTSAAAEPAVQPAVTELVTRLGFYRVSVDAAGDPEAEAARVREALAALAEDCRGT